MVQLHLGPRFLASKKYEVGSMKGIPFSSYFLPHTSYLPDRAHSSVGRAIDLHSIGQEFESPWVHDQNTKSAELALFVL